MTNHQFAKASFGFDHSSQPRMYCNGGRKAHPTLLRRSLSRLYDTLGRLESQTDAYEHTTRFSYDNNDNLDIAKDALLRETDNDYDALGRLKRTLQNATGGQANAPETKFEYDALDNLTKVIDPNQLSTHYVYNGLGELKSLQSPDTGTTGYSYDAAGNRESQTDARGVQTQYAYDVLNRITAVAYPSDGSLNTRTVGWASCPPFLSLSNNQSSICQRVILLRSFFATTDVLQWWA